jgi:hypothetical protein
MTIDACATSLRLTARHMARSAKHVADPSPVLDSPVERAPANHNAEHSADAASIRRRYVAIALCSATVILLQIAVTRILSVVVWYHWAFFSISLAMLGVGAPGVWFALRPPKSTRLLTGLLLTAAGLLPAASIAIVKASRSFPNSTILFCLACLLPPVLCLGAAICQLLLESEGPAIGRMYAFDLLGAFGGALLVIPLLWAIPTPTLVGSLALLPLAACLLLGGSRPGALAVLLALGVLLVWQEPFTLRHGKNYTETEAARPIYERWTPTARITVFDNLFFMQHRAAFGWGMGTVPANQAPPQQFWIEQDGSAGTPITQFDGDTNKLQYLLHDVTSVGYQLRPPKSAAIIGGGGGRDALTALALGTRSLMVIELNAAIVELMRTEFSKFTGGLYDDPRVETIVGEGRSVLTRTDRKFDLIQISLIDSWAASAAGAYSLAENNLYTVEAYRLYFSRLNQHGLVATSRWMQGSFGIELPRLLFLVKAALEAEGVAEPLRHMVLMQGKSVGTVLMLRSPLTDAELAQLQQIASARGFVLHLPAPAGKAGERGPAQLVVDGPSAYERFGLRMQPPTDDRPFFFQVFSPLRPIPDAILQFGINAEGVGALQKLMLVMAVITLIMFFAPFAFGRWLRHAPEFWRASTYFSLIGCAFMFIEVAWLQRFILYLGHPSLATTVVLGSVLLGAGIGSMNSARISVARAQRLGFIVALSALATNASLAPIFSFTLGYSWPLRLMISVLLIAPTSAGMGCCFPLGMIRFGDGNKAWFWALNGAASVLASVLSLALSMEIGLSRVAMLGALLYLAVWLLLRASRRAQRA